MLMWIAKGRLGRDTFFCTFTISFASELGRGVNLSLPLQRGFLAKLFLSIGLNIRKTCRGRGGASNSHLKTHSAFFHCIDSQFLKLIQRSTLVHLKSKLSSRLFLQHLPSDQLFLLGVPCQRLRIVRCLIRKAFAVTPSYGPSTKPVLCTWLSVKLLSAQMLSVNVRA